MLSRGLNVAQGRTASVVFEIQPFCLPYPSGHFFVRKAVGVKWLTIASVRSTAVEEFVFEKTATLWSNFAPNCTDQEMSL